MANNEIKVIGIIDYPDGTSKKAEDLTAEELRAFRDNNGNRMAKAFQNHFAQNPNEF